MSRLRPLGFVVVVLGAGVLAAGVWIAPRLEWGAPEAPWADPLPAHALEEGYGAFYRWRGGPAWRAWEEGWLERSPPRADGPVLIDTVHTVKQPWTADLPMDAYGYSKMHGFARAFAPIRAAGVEVVEAPWRWSGRALAGASAVFINLPSGDAGALRTAEVVAIEAFVRRGGGLVLITDHSNCYFHAELLEPLTRALGITLPPVTAADPSRRLTPHSVSWIQVKADHPHPVMAGVNTFAMMTAGAVAGLPALATTSPTSWFDRWEPYRKGESAGFTGDLERQKDERPGPVPVVAAGAHGAGRVVVLADQNAWGATLIGYEDNARLFTNAMGWAMGRPLPPPTRGPETVTTLMSPVGSDCTSVARAGFRTLQVQAQRWAAKTGRGEGCTAGGAGESGGVVLLPGPTRADLGALLAPNRRVLAVLDAESEGTAAFLTTLGLTRLPDDPRGAPATWGMPRPEPDGVPVLEGGDDRIEAHPIGVSGPMEVWMEDALGRPVVAMVAHGGARVILLFDSALLRNGALGKERDDPREAVAAGGSSRTLAAHRLAHRLLAELFVP